MSISALIVRILMAGGAVIGCIALYLAISFLHSRLAERRLLQDSERLREARQKRRESAEHPTSSGPIVETPLSEGEVDPKARAKELRERIESLHSRLNVRSGAYLALNGSVLGILAGFNPTPIWSVVLTLAAILVNFFSWSSNSMYIYDLRFLHHEYARLNPNDPAERALEEAGVTAGGISPAIIFGQYLPITVMVGWFVFLVVIWPF